MKQTKCILVAISSAHAASRQKLRGIYRYSALKDDWDILLVRSPVDLTAEVLDNCANGGIDGFILSSDECSAEIARAIPKEKPVVAIEVGAHIPLNRSRRNTLELKTDNGAIGEMAAKHFKSLGHFASFVYIPDEKDRDWSRLRGVAFVDALHSAAGHSEIFDASHESLPKFLSRQKLPVAVFAAWDFVAAKVIRACHESGLSIPSQVAVLGVDNDDLICESVRPALSSILIDRAKQGFIAAKMLDSMMKSRFRETKHVCRPLKVVERESTTYISPGNIVVDRARKFIADHAGESLSVQDVADALHISRRLLDMRFAESAFGSVAATVRARQLSSAKRFLKQTSLSDARIAERCGFNNVGTLRNLFRRTYGMSMRAWRTHNARKTT
jgi:LacI family transcriptional regulator